MSHKRNEIEVKPCSRFDCPFLNDPSHVDNEYCLKFPKGKERKALSPIQSSDEDTDNPKCQETVKIFVRGEPPPGDREVQKDSTLNLQTMASKPKESSKSKKRNASPKRSKSPRKEKPERKASPKREKSFCWPWRRKHEKINNVPPPEAQESDTSRGFKNVRSQTITAPSVSSMELGDILKNHSHCGRPGGCNTNTIIFPRDKSSGDGNIACLENLLRSEAKATRCNLEDILNEVHKQRRELQDMKDMLDNITRVLKEHFYMNAFGKGKVELLHVQEKKNTLERKSNALSITESFEKEMANLKDVGKVPPPEVPKRKPFFPWCK